MVPGFDEVDGSASKLSVGGNILWNNWRHEIVKIHKKLYAQEVVANKVLQKEKLDVPAEVLKQIKKISISAQCLTEGTILTNIVSTDAFERQVEPVCDPLVEPSGTVDGLQAIYLVRWEDHHGANGVPDCRERFFLRLG